MSKKSVHSTIVMIAWVFLVSCSGDVTGPSESLDARYDALRIGDARVPYVEAPKEGTPPGCQEVHIGGHLILHSSGRFDLVLDRWHYVCDGEAGGGGSVSLGVGPYRLIGNELVLETEFGLITADFVRDEWVGEHTRQLGHIEFEWGGTTFTYVNYGEPSSR